MTRMPSLLRPAYGVLLAAAALALVAVLAAPAQAALPGVEVTITSPDGDEQQVWLNEIKNPENFGTYPIRNRNGTTTSVTVEKGNGVSVRQLLAEKGFEFGYSTISIDFGERTVKLTKDQVNNPNYSPTIYVDATGQLWFLRPSTSANDYNAGDHFKITASALTIAQTPATLAVKLKASRTKIDPGETVSFTTTVSGGPPGAQYLYIWNFDDGERIPDGGRSESHKFAKACTCHVQVNVKIAGESRSDPSNVVKVQVGDPKKSDKDREGGGDNTADGAPTSGTTTGSSGVGSTYDGSSTYTPVPSTPTPPPPTPDPTTPDITTSGTPVEGNLLADVSDPPPTNILESARRAARDGNPQDANDGDVGVSEAAVSIFAALALLGLGAGIETRQGRLPRLRLPRRSA
jgi:PKD domain-containing protein